MSEDKKVVHEDIFSTCPKCSKWRMHVRVTRKMSGEIDICYECFELGMDLRCLNCGYHKHFWANEIVDVENIFYLCGSGPDEMPLLKHIELSREELRERANELYKQMVNEMSDK